MVRKHRHSAFKSTPRNVIHIILFYNTASAILEASSSNCQGVLYLNTTELNVLF